jgi:hypothetical protein
MKSVFVRHTAHDFAEALRANPLAIRDVRELLAALDLTYDDLILANVPETDLQKLVTALQNVKPKLSLAAKGMTPE